MVSLGCGVERYEETYLGSPVLCSTLGCGQLSPAFGATFARVAVIGVAGAHVIGRASNGWINGVRGAGRMRVLLRVLGERLDARLACAGSEEVFS